jgi:hypothetical protein
MVRMGIFHVATLTPTKADLVTSWIPTQPWGPSPETPVEVIGAFRFEDPNGQVGMETHIVNAGGTLTQVPLTYRDAPLEGCEDALVTEMEHSALGTRWVYDGLRDDLFVIMLAGVALTGQGEALGMIMVDGRWNIAPAGVRIRGGGWTPERVPVDGFKLESDSKSTDVLFRSDRFELKFFRHPAERPRPAIGLTATWEAHPNPVVLAEIREGD